MAWSQYGTGICYLIMILVLWTYIRKLDQTLQRSSG